MQAHVDGRWTFQEFLGWAFSDPRVAQLAGTVHDAALRAQHLCDVPADDCVRAELIKNLAGIAHQAERLQLDFPAALARRLGRVLRTEAGPDVVAEVRDGCGALERGVAEQFGRAGMATHCQSAA